MLSTLTQESWDAKVIELSGSILQSFVWGEFQKAFGCNILRYSGDDYLCLLVESSLPAGKKYFFSPRGPIGNVAAVLEDIKQLSQDSSVVFLRLEPYQKLNLPKAIKEVQPPHNWMLDITKTEQELLIGMKPKTRYNINLAQRKGVVVREGSKDDLISFWQLILETAARGSFRLHPQEYYWQMWESLSPNNIKLLVAEFQGKVLAGMIMTLFSDTATYLHGGSSKSLKEYMAPYLLHWEAIKLSKQLGFETYDFGGVAPGTDEKTGTKVVLVKHSWAGISRFKKSFGGFQVDYPGTYDLVFSPVWYNVYKNARALRNLIR